MLIGIDVRDSSDVIRMTHRVELEIVMKDNDIHPSRLYNVDETEVTINRYIKVLYASKYIIRSAKSDTGQLRCTFLER